MAVHKLVAHTAVPPKERALILTAYEVRAVLAGHKDQHRVPLNPQPMRDGGLTWYHVSGPRWQTGGPDLSRCPLGKPGGRLWVREAWQEIGLPDLSADDADVFYAADNPKWPWPTGDWKWKAPASMSRPYSRILLEVTAIEVVRLHQMDAAAAKREGIIKGLTDVSLDMIENFQKRWNTKHRGPYGWDANPLCWLATFKVLEVS